MKELWKENLTMLGIPLLGGTFLTALLFSWGMIQRQPAAFTPLENIDGIAYPVVNQHTSITESFAHTDVLLPTSRFGKNLHLKVTFNPGNADYIGVAVRENSFWFSYQPVTMYSGSEQIGAAQKNITKEITIPLTDKIQSADGSLDLLFFARDKTTSLDPAHQRVDDTITWFISDVSAHVSYTSPTWPQAKQFLKRFMYRERPI